MKIQILKRDETTNDRHRSVESKLFLNCFFGCKEFNVDRVLKLTQTTPTQTCPSYTHTHTVATPPPPPPPPHTQIHPVTQMQESREKKRRKRGEMVSWPLMRFLVQMSIKLPTSHSNSVQMFVQNLNMAKDLCVCRSEI